MPEPVVTTPKRVLDPIARVSEILYGLLMVLTFTVSFSVSAAERHDTRTMLIAAFGCSVAWGIVDAVMFVMMNLTARAHARVILRRVRRATDLKRARQAIADALPKVVTSVLDDDELEMIRGRLVEMPEPADQLIGKRDWLGAVLVFLLVVASTCPVVLPYLIVDDPWIAMHLSNVVAILMLFACGWSLGRFAGRKPWRVGLVMVAVGAILAAMTLVLGG